MIQIKENFTPYHFYKGGNKPKYIVIHYFGGLSSALGAAEWFKDPRAQGSAHYCVDEKPIIYHCVRDEDMAWHCGAVGGLHYIHPECRNCNSIGVEMRPSKINKSSVNANDKDWYFDEKVVENTIWLVKQLMKKYNIPPENVIRHWDVTGKICPAPYVGAYYNTYYKTTGDKQWKKFKERIDDEVVERSKIIVNGKEIPVERILKDGTNYVKVRDLAAALNLEVGFKGNIATLTSKEDK